MWCQTQQRRTVRPHREPELGIKPGVEIGQRLGIGLVQPVLKTPPVTSGPPVPVHMIVHQCQITDGLGDHRANRHRLQAIRNLSASEPASRSE